MFKIDRPSIGKIIRPGVRPGFLMLKIDRPGIGKVICPGIRSGFLMFKVDRPGIGKVIRPGVRSGFLMLKIDRPSIGKVIRPGICSGFGMPKINRPIVRKVVRPGIRSGFGVGKVICPGQPMPKFIRGNIIGKLFQHIIILNRVIFGFHCRKLFSPISAVNGNSHVCKLGHICRRKFPIFQHTENKRGHQFKPGYIPVIFHIQQGRIYGIMPRNGKRIKSGKDTRCKRIWGYFPQTVKFIHFLHPLPFLHLRNFPVDRKFLPPGLPLRLPAYQVPLVLLPRYLPKKKQGKPKYSARKVH